MELCLIFLHNTFVVAASHQCWLYTCSLSELLYCTFINRNVVIIVKLNHPSYGIVRVWKKNNYGMVCADGFDENAARVVCKEFGYRYSIEVCCMGLEPEPTDMEFAMSDVNCDGTESGLRACRNEYADPNCSTDNYASVFCTNTDPANSASMLQKSLLQFLVLDMELTFLTRFSSYLFISLLR